MSRDTPYNDEQLYICTSASKLKTSFVVYMHMRIDHEFWCTVRQLVMMWMDLATLANTSTSTACLLYTSDAADE